jgi:RNA polymerase sigma-70 factor (ECF subfamily)
LELLILFLALSKDSSIDDVQLSINIRNGDQKAFKTFYDKHYPGLYRFMISRGMSHDEAEDLIQKAFIMIWEKRDGIDETKSLRAYLFQIAYSRMLNHVEYHSKFRDEDPPDNDISEKSPESDTDYSELLHQIKKIIAGMPEKRALVFELCFMKQFTYKETADAMDVSPKTVENHMALAFKDMRAALKEVYGEEILNRNDF